MKLKQQQRVSQKRKVQQHIHFYCICGIHNSQVMETAMLAPTNEWIKKIWYLYTMEFYSAMKKNEILSFPNKWTGEHHPEKG
jgi:hypothetical protein